MSWDIWSVKVRSLLAGWRWVDGVWHCGAQGLQWELVVWGDAIGNREKRELQGEEQRWSWCAGRAIWWCNSKTWAATARQSRDWISLSAKNETGQDCRCRSRAVLLRLALPAGPWVLSAVPWKLGGRNSFRGGKRWQWLSVRDLSTAVPPALT